MKRLDSLFAMPPSWRTLRIMNLVCCVLTLMLAAIPPINWVSLVDTFLAGFLFAAAIHAHMQHAMAEHRARLIEENDQAMQIINLLMQERAVTIMAHGDDPAPIQPTRH